MKTGAERIAKERQEQINKHGYDSSHDAEHVDNELIKAALFAINPYQFEPPYEWERRFIDRIINKNKIERLVVAGALIAAEIDRLQSKIEEDDTLDMDNI